MQILVPGLTADDVLHTFEAEAFTLFLGAAIATSGLVAAGRAVIRRERASRGLHFALVAMVDPVPAFLFFDGAGFLLRKARIVTYSFYVVFAILALATLITGPSNLYAQTNSVLVIVVLLVLLAEPMRGHAADRDFIVARRGLLIFAGFALWDNVIGVFGSRLPRIEPLGFVALLACLGYVAARQSMQQEQQLADIQKELEVARRIQLSILPSEFPKSAKFHVAARYVPMTSVAGDFYDYVLADDSRAGLLIADVSGHGVPAALIASMVKLAATSQRSQADDPAALLLGMNAALHGNTQSQFVTAAYVYLDAQAKEFRYSAAGHPPMLLLRDGKVSEIAENGLMLAAFDFAVYQAVNHPLRPGDRLLLYTDGIVEATNSAGEFFGQEKLSDLLRNTNALNAHDTADRIIHSIQEWSKSQDDDLTVLVCDYAA